MFRELAELVTGAALAWIIAGEAPTCPVPAKVAIAQVYANRQAAQVEGGWFGWQEPQAIDAFVALHWQRWPDLTQGALYAIGPGDAAKMPWLRRLVIRWDCKAGDFVEIWQ